MDGDGGEQLKSEAWGRERPEGQFWSQKKMQKKDGGWSLKKQKQKL